MPKSRIAELRTFLELSQKEFAEEIGITQGALSQLEAGKSKLSLSTIRKISLKFNVDCNWLINGTREVFLADAAPDDVYLRHFSASTLISLVKEEAHAGYIDNCKDLDYISTLDVYRIPGFENGHYRLFEVSGDSMVPSIYPREIVVTEYLEDKRKVEYGQLCVVITSDGIVAKRLYFYEEQPDAILLKSDNPDYKTYSLGIDDVLEVWLVRAKITNVLAQPAPPEAKRIEMLESDIQMLKEQMKRFVDRNDSADPEWAE